MQRHLLDHLNLPRHKAFLKPFKAFTSLKNSIILPPPSWFVLTLDSSLFQRKFRNTPKEGVLDLIWSRQAHGMTSKFPLTTQITSNLLSIYVKRATNLLRVIDLLSNYWWVMNLNLLSFISVGFYGKNNRFSHDLLSSLLSLHLFCKHSTRNKTM